MPAVFGTVDESTYTGGRTGADHPVVWCTQVDDGRTWVTSMGHTADSWLDPEFVELVMAGLELVMDEDISCLPD